MAWRMARARTTLSRLAVNATLAGFWASALLALLVFYLDSSVSLTPRNYWPVASVVVLAYGPASGIAWALLAGAVRLFVAFRVPVPWVGFRPFWRFLVADFCLLCAAYAHNLRLSRDYLPAAMQDHLTSATLLLILGTTLLAVDAVWRGLTRRRFRPLAAALAALLLSAGLFGIRQRYRDVKLPPSASEIEVIRPTGGILLFGIDGATPDDLFPMATDGRLPALGALSRAGTSAPLSAPCPPRMAAAWATIVTGRAPAAHGVMEGTLFAPRGGHPLFRVLPAATGLRNLLHLGLLRGQIGRSRPAVPTLDRILARSGYRVVAAGWEGLLDDTPVPAGSTVVDRWPSIAPHVERLRDHLREVRDRPDEAPLAAALGEALRRDLAVGAATLAALDRTGDGPPTRRALLVRMAGLDAVAHVFTRYSHPDRFGNVPPRDVERLGQVIPDYYRFLDAWLEAMRGRLGPEPTVLVVSPYGVAPVGVGRRVFQALTGSGHQSGTHRNAGPGLLLAVGPGVRAGGRLEHASAADVLPTLLYLRDLPVGRDMEGEPLHRLASDTFADRHALAAVPSWETVSIVSPPVW